MGYVIDIAELKLKIEELGIGLQILDVRKNREGGPIAGAIELDVEQVISGKEEFFAPAAVMAERFGELGIKENQDLVFIDNGTYRESAKALFAFYYLGHRGRLHMLQGAYPAFKASGLTLSSPAARKPVRYLADVREHAFVSFDEIKERMQDPSSVLIDSRSYERYAGWIEKKYRKAGHIPGAINIHAKRVFTEDGKWHRKEVLEGIFSSIDKQDDVIASCGSGGSACLNAVALLEAGYEQVSLYPGGYAEWLERGEPIARKKKALDDQEEEGIE